MDVCILHYVYTISFFFFCRGFNDAISGFNDDGWSVLGCDGVEDVIVAVNSTKNLGTHVSPANALPVPGSILCAKASMLLQVNCQLLTIFTVHLLSLSSHHYIS